MIKGMSLHTTIDFLIIVFTYSAAFIHGRLYERARWRTIGKTKNDKPDDKNTPK
jgi:hypothetical protein